MPANREPVNTPSQPALPDLLARYLQQQASAHQSGLAYPEATGEVVPYEAAPAQPVDPRTAWNEALAVLRCYNPAAANLPVETPSDWPALVSTHEPAAALAFCVGNFPQLVRNLQPLWQATRLQDLRPAGGSPVALPSPLDWAAEAERTSRFPQLLIAVGALRLARQFDRASELLRKSQTRLPAEWRSAWANEEAALAWHRGEHDQAAALWQAQEASVPVLFNRGMAALFAGQRKEARKSLTQAIAQLPEDSAWHHLGCLYLALAEI
jgi:tetratricopeptide (TPR) repeat protein